MSDSFTFGDSYRISELCELVFINLPNPTRTEETAQTQLPGVAGPCRCVLSIGPTVEERGGLKTCQHTQHTQNTEHTEYPRIHTKFWSLILLKYKDCEMKW